MASTSSSTQKGVGEIFNRAKTSATAVRLRSPPDNSTRPCSRFPGRRASISIPPSMGELSSDRIRRAEPPLNNRANILLNSTLTALKVFKNARCITSFSSVIMRWMSSIAACKSAIWFVRLAYLSLTSAHSFSASKFTTPMRRMWFLRSRISSSIPAGKTGISASVSITKSGKGSGVETENSFRYSNSISPKSSSMCVRSESSLSSLRPSSS